jgi:DNA-binding GntR family transcriptional regulator
MITASTLSDLVYKELLRQIVAGELRSGCILREPQLALQLGVSRTPIREALTRLAEGELLEIRPNRSAMVRHLGRDELLHIYQVREALEGLAAELACGRLTAPDHARLKRLAAAARDEEAATYVAACHVFDVELHRLVGRRSGNPVLARQIERLHTVVHLLRERIGDQEGALRRTYRQHLDLLAALRAGDAAASRRAMVEHLRTSFQFAVRCAADDAEVRAPAPGRGHALAVPQKKV